MINSSIGNIAFIHCLVGVNDNLVGVKLSLSRTLHTMNFEVQINWHGLGEIPPGQIFKVKSSPFIIMESLFFDSGIPSF